MAIPSHLEIVLRGAQAIADWRAANPSLALDLVEADLRRVDLTRANLSKAILTGANLEWADFRWSDFQGADLSGTKLVRADFFKADLRGANFRTACLDHATNLEGAIYDSTTQFPTAFKPNDHGLILRDS